jgi:uncharacterized protein (TIGR02757 family)
MNVKKLLDTYYKKYNNHLSSKDPIWNLQFVNSDLDREILAFIISCYAYGSVIQINKHINKILNLSSANVFDFILNFNQKNLDKEESLYYRFNTEKDFIDLIYSLKHIIEKFGSLKNLFLKHYNKSDKNILPALNKFTNEIRKSVKHSKTFDYLIPDVEKNSTCKRLNLFLRWMVRKDSVDTGHWGREVDKAKLIIPVDTHVYKVSRKLGLVERKSCDMKFAIELTEKLKTFDSNDPVKYDFALCHIGIDKVKLPSK